MPETALNWKIVGAAGEGVKSTGLLFSKMCLRHGLFTFDYTDYPSLIRGGHNTYQVMAGNKKVHSQEKYLDILIALNQNGAKYNANELTDSSLFIYDGPDTNFDPTKFKLKGQLLNVPLVQLAKQAGAQRVMANNVALGVSVFLLSLDITILDAVIKDVFGSKGDQVVSLNQKAAHAGHEYAKTNLKPLDTVQVQKQKPVDTISFTGNDAVCLGAVAGGLKAYIAYPMTPSSSILHTLADWAESTNILVKHAEDEIGVINMALGASFAGVRTALGTSGGGFCYMTEALGLSGVAELPLVIFEVMRPGPALGMPTWTAQADLLFAIYASQDEFPRIVLAPGDVYDAFELTRLAFELAEKYQIPVIILSDKHLGESAQSAHFDTTKFSAKQVSIDPSPKLSENGFYPRYAFTDTGVSLRTIPGQKNGYHIANSYESDQFGIGTEAAKDRSKQMDKRFKKMESIEQEIPTQFYNGENQPDITFISWGSTKTAIQAGVEKLRDEGINAASFNLSWMWPFPTKQVIDVIQKSKIQVVVEGNKTSQLAQLIRSQTGIDIYHKRTKYSGRPFYPHQIVDFAKEILKK